MKHSTRTSFFHRLATALAVAGLLAVALFAAQPSHAATVVISKLHMADQPNSNQAAVDHFLSGVKTVYFDYNVSFPFAQDIGRVEVYRNGTTGPVVGHASLIFAASGATYVPIEPDAGGAWPDGAYCTVLVIGNEVSPDGHDPIPWTVGNASKVPCPTPKSPGNPGATSTPTTGTPPSGATSTPTPTATTPGSSMPALTVYSHSLVKAHHAGNVRVTVKDPSGAAVAGARVTLNGRKAGISKIQTLTTGPKGVATFHRIKAGKAGKLVITAVKSGYLKTTFSLLVVG